MSDFLKNVNFLENFSAAILILNICLVNRLDRHLFTSQFVHTESNLSESALTQQFYELVKVKRGLRNCVVLFDVRFDVFNQTSTILGYWIVQNDFLLTILTQHLIFEILVAKVISWTRRISRTLLLELLRVIHLLTWLEAVVVDVNSKVLALSVCVYHKLNCRNFNLAGWLILMKFLLIV